MQMLDYITRVQKKIFNLMTRLHGPQRSNNTRYHFAFNARVVLASHRTIAEYLVGYL